jgi:hypothetical protein
MMMQRLCDLTDRDTDRRADRQRRGDLFMRSFDRSLPDDERRDPEQNEPCKKVQRTCKYCTAEDGRRETPAAAGLLPAITTTTTATAKAIPDDS